MPTPEQALEAMTRENERLGLTYDTPDMTAAEQVERAMQLAKDCTGKYANEANWHVLRAHLERMTQTIPGGAWIDGGVTEPEVMFNGLTRAEPDATASVAGLTQTAPDVPLPEPDTHCEDLDTGLSCWSHSPAQLRDYGQQCANAARLAALEEAAEVVENANTPDCGGWSARGIAEDIRALAAAGDA